MVTVVVNRSREERQVQIVAPGARTHRVYRTTSEPGVNLQFTGTMRSDQLLTVPARSFTTLVAG